ncbi:hypothetical protein XFF7766_680004 [Xanthomonas citri pv. fuscans]|uniref:Uncharacterized protein n=1 Tax=Xanthomonas campestris pv. phaseoli TaxID=317013 RepID=A0A7Z7IX63_XANCH|nr:hypothetical protein XFF6960_190004 [Xanthomonas citri pv. fuscans]SOO15839.1 hypothetical protein XFF7766_680004 [Xanthomonas citri pv. fuscans]SOO23238.1 hypothetical protein XFF6991_180349 [Xanthomonas phaseoli pv. phaseoli]
MRGLMCGADAPGLGSRDWGLATAPEIRCSGRARCSQRGAPRDDAPVADSAYVFQASARVRGLLVIRLSAALSNTTHSAAGRLKNSVTNKASRAVQSRPASPRRRRRPW